MIYSSLSISYTLHGHPRVPEEWTATRSIHHTIATTAQATYDALNHRGFLPLCLSFRPRFKSRRTSITRRAAPATLFYQHLNPCLACRTRVDSTMSELLAHPPSYRPEKWQAARRQRTHGVTNCCSFRQGQGHLFSRF